MIISSIDKQKQTIGNFISNFDLNEIAFYFCFLSLFLLVVKPKWINNYFFIMLFLAILQAKREGIKVSLLELGISGFLIGILISLFDAANAFRGIDQIRKMVMWIFIPMMIGQFRFSDKQRHAFIYPIFGAFFVYAVFGLKEFFIGPPGYYGPRVSGGFTISQYSLNLSFFILIFLTFLIYGKLKSKYRLIVLFSSILATFVLVLTMTRKAWISTLFASIFILKFKNKKYLLVFLVGLFIIGIVGIYGPDNIYLDRLKSIVDFQKDKSILARFEIYRESFRLFSENPLTGIGYDNFIEAQNQENLKIQKRYVHPHNMILKMLCETGVVGLSGYLFLMGVVFNSCWKKGRHNIFALALMGCLVSLVVCDLFSANIGQRNSYTFVFFILGIINQNDYKNLFVLVKKSEFSGCV